LPFNPEVILKTLPSIDATTSPSRPQMPLLTYTSETGKSIHIPVTPTNLAQVKALFEEILQGDLDLVIASKVQKICKATDKAMADSKIQHTTNDVLLEAVNAKKARKYWKNQTWGYARVMNAQFLFDRQQEADEREYEATKKAFLRLGPYLFNAVAGKKELRQRAKPKPKLMASPVKQALGTANFFATPLKPLAVLVKTPKKRGRPQKNPVALAPVLASVLVPEPKPDPDPILTHTGRKVKVKVHYRC